jgi:flagellar M-ring protein FliF
MSTVVQTASSAASPVGAGFSLGGASGRNKLIAAAAAAAMIAVIAGSLMWAKQPEYRPLFTQLSEKDGGAVIAALSQMNVPYKFADGSSAILVPAEKVHETRLRLASQGLPKGGIVGFELMEAQKFGVSQFVEQLNYQRGLEGELARSIQSLAAVESARVHLALPKQSVFMREQQKPSASVILHLSAGRTLAPGQAQSIAHLVASSVPELQAANVTIVDQTGARLSDNGQKAQSLDPSQLKYLHELETSYIRRIEAIIAPIVGAENVRAQVTADIDFTQSEQTAELHKPNQNPGEAAVRSQQRNEATENTREQAGGIPGAASNQPPGAASAPLDAPGAQAINGSNAANAATPTSRRSDSVINYEVDRTIRYTQQPMGNIKRLSAAVVVNYLNKKDAEGKVIQEPLADAQKEQLSALIKEAMGFNKDRGDSFNLTNTPFVQVDKAPINEVPWWQAPQTIDYAMALAKYLIALCCVLVFYFGVARRWLKPRLATAVNGAAPLQALAAPAGSGSEVLDNPGQQPPIDRARTIAKENPALVANVIKSWTEKDGK